jgi:hypothetical protein
MTRLMTEREQHVAGHELDAVFDLLRSLPPVVARIVLEHLRDVENSLLKLRYYMPTSPRIRLGDGRRLRKQDQERQGQGRPVDPPCKVDHAITNDRAKPHHGTHPVLCSARRTCQADPFSHHRAKRRAHAGVEKNVEPSSYGFDGSVNPLGNENTPFG